MRILKIKITKRKGFIHLIPTEEEDLWSLVNLVSVGDIVRTKTFRKVIRQSDFGAKDVQKQSMTVSLSIQKVKYSQDDEISLELKGLNIQKSKYLAIGQAHTVQILLNFPISVEKDSWNAFHYHMINQFQNPQHDVHIAALVMEEGVAHLCYIKTAITLIKEKITQSIPKKQSGFQQHDLALKKFFARCLDAICKLDFTYIRCLIIASPGFLKEDFMKFVDEMITKDQYKQMWKKFSIREKIVLTTCSSGYKQALLEALESPQLQQKIADTQAIKEIQVLAELKQNLILNPDLVAYGNQHVNEAVNAGAVSKLLILDRLLRSADLSKRQYYNRILEKHQAKGSAIIFSSQHASGEELNRFSGIIAFLKFPVTICEDNPWSSSDESDNEQQEEQNGKVNHYAQQLSAVNGESDVSSTSTDNGNDDLNFGDEEIDEFLKE